VTSRQDGGAHMWTKAEVDASAAAGEMTRSAVRGSHLSLRSTNGAARQPTWGPGPARAYVPVVTGPCGAASVLTHRRETQIRSRCSRRQRSIGPVVSLAARR
jgi:hypothetical protein